MNEREQFELENYLREFQPRAPRALSPVGKMQNWRRLAAAIAIVFLSAASIWSSLRRTGRKTTVVKEIAAEAPTAASTIPLTKLALEKPAELEAALDARSQKILQHFDRSDSSLRMLAKQ